MEWVSAHLSFLVFLGMWTRTRPCLFNCKAAEEGLAHRVQGTNNRTDYVTASQQSCKIHYNSGNTKHKIFVILSCANAFKDAHMLVSSQVHFRKGITFSFFSKALRNAIDDCCHSSPLLLVVRMTFLSCTLIQQLL